MSVAIVTQSNVQISNWERIQFSVHLPDLEQIIIQANSGGYYYDSTTNQWATKTELKKFRLTTFDYDFQEGVIKLNSIRGNFFTKANRVGARDSYLNVIDQALLDQIPDTLHDHAREHFAKELQPMLQKIIDTGLVINTKQ